MTTYKVKVVGHGIIFRSASRASAYKRAAECVPEARATVLSIPESR